MNKKGITLIALTITLLVLVVLSTTTIYFGTRALHRTNNFKIYSNLSLIYSKIEEISEKHDFNPIETDLIGSVLTEEMKTTLTGLGLNVNDQFWRFLTVDDLEKMSLPKRVKELETNIFVNYNTLEIVSTKGYRMSNGTFVYKYSEMKELEELNNE